MWHEHHVRRVAYGPGPGRGPGFRAFGRRPVPSREEWVERLEAHREQLQQDLANVEELLGRLRDEPAHGGE
jgi:hypothetical protein